ncbi:MAG: flagellar biosynthetic protein FliO, partial [Gammaproteobacteria bacterium]|nr:flagellar biosynthetic protein FliO [Gammaproteobacteria bacterium]
QAHPGAGVSPAMREHSLVVLLLLAGPALADGAQKSVATGGLPAGDLTAAAIRMVIGLAVVLALLGATAWVSRRFRVGAGMRGGLIEVVSGLSLGARERVVLIRVGGDQVLVGVSPSGMRTLHVLQQNDGQNREFSNYLDRNP